MCKLCVSGGGQSWAKNKMLELETHTHKHTKSHTQNTQTHPPPSPTHTIHTHTYAGTCCPLQLPSTTSPSSLQPPSQLWTQVQPPRGILLVYYIYTDIGGVSQSCDHMYGSFAAESTTVETCMSALLASPTCVYVCLYTNSQLCMCVYIQIHSCECMCMYLQIHSCEWPYIWSYPCLSTASNDAKIQL
jgi:hypothetical protein